MMEKLLKVPVAATLLTPIILSIIDFGLEYFIVFKPHLSFVFYIMLTIISYLLLYFIVYKSSISTKRKDEITIKENIRFWSVFIITILLYFIFLGIATWLNKEDNIVNENFSIQIGLYEKGSHNQNVLLKKVNNDLSSLIDTREDNDDIGVSFFYDKINYDNSEEKVLQKIIEERKIENPVIFIYGEYNDEMNYENINLYNFPYDSIEIQVSNLKKIYLQNIDTVNFKINDSKELGDRNEISKHIANFTYGIIQYYKGNNLDAEEFLKIDKSIFKDSASVGTIMYIEACNLAKNRKINESIRKFEKVKEYTNKFDKRIKKNLKAFRNLDYDEIFLYDDVTKKGLSINFSVINIHNGDTIFKGKTGEDGKKEVYLGELDTVKIMYDNQVYKDFSEKIIEVKKEIRLKVTLEHN